MNIIINQKNDLDIKNCVNAFFYLSDKCFEDVIKLLSSDKRFLENIVYFIIDSEYENLPLELQYKLVNDLRECLNNKSFTRKIFSISQIFKEIDYKLKSLKIGTKEYFRLEKILKTRDFEAFKSWIIFNDKENRYLIDNVFKIISDEVDMEKFLNYEKNIEEFSIDGEQIEKSKYLRLLGKIFGYKEKNGDISNRSKIENNFYIPELQKYIKRYLKIYDEINMDRFANPQYEFKRFILLKQLSNEVIRKDDETYWNINKELYNSVMKDMPKDLTLEEKAMYIYCKLCIELSYNDEYFFTNKLKHKIPNGYIFEKNNLENIKPGSKITCWDFARVFSKFVNKLDGDIEAVIISEGANYGHFLTGFYTDNVSVMLEAINTKTYGTNDLMKAKNGIDFEGIEIISDKNDLINKALKKVYQIIYKKQADSIDIFLDKIKKLQFEKNPNDFEFKMNFFLDLMIKKGIYGNEALQTLLLFYKTNFFGVELEKAYIGKKNEQCGKTVYKRVFLIKQKNEKKEIDDIYLVDLNSLELLKATKEEIIYRISIGEFVYESEYHKLKDIDIIEK